MKRLVAHVARRFLYPLHRGGVSRHDPTYGQVDRDIQWKVNGLLAPDASIAQRLAIELTLQRRREGGAR